MDIIKKIAQEIGCRDSQVEAAVKRCGGPNARLLK